MPQEIDYRTSENLDLVKITKFIQSLGYEVIELKQLWRHITGKIRKENKDYFFKLATTIQIGTRTENEASWNENIQSFLTQESFFQVPKIYQKGYDKNGRFYYISEYIEGGLLLDKGNFKESDFAFFSKFLPQIADFNFHLASLKLPESFKLTRDSSRLINKDEFKQEILKKAENWASQTAASGVGVDLNSNLNFFKTNFDSLKFGLNHGDFVPWHLIYNTLKDKIYLIDAEHSTLFNLLYYDIAYFYHRLYTTAKRPDLAKEYLSLVSKKFPKEKLEEFLKLFKVVLGLRIIGGFWDFRNQDNLDFHFQIQNEFLQLSKESF